MSSTPFPACSGARRKVSVPAGQRVQAPGAAACLRRPPPWSRWMGYAPAFPAAVRASHICRLVTTLCSHRRSAAAHSGRPCSSLGRCRVAVGQMDVPDAEDPVMVQPGPRRARLLPAAQADRGGRSGSCPRSWPRCFPAVSASAIGAFRRPIGSHATVRSANTAAAVRSAGRPGRPGRLIDLHRSAATHQSVHFPW